MIKICLIEDVSNQLHGIVTTSSAHLLKTGAHVVIRVPNLYGMELYGKTKIRVLGARRFSTQIDTLQLLPFILPVKLPSCCEPAHCFPVAWEET